MTVMIRYTFTGWVAVHVPLTAPSIGSTGSVLAAVTARTRLLILNSPHNPTGMVMQEADIVALSALCPTRYLPDRRRGLWNTWYLISASISAFVRMLICMPEALLFLLW